MNVALPGALREAMGEVQRLVVLTGAGMSTESGVPVFRGPGGLWEGHRPEELATPDAFARDPEKVWRWYRWRLEKVSAARPHPGHDALVSLEQDGRLREFALVTQNVDGLHQRAGSRTVIELHGNITRARCTRGCGQTPEAERVDPSRSECACGGRFRPDVVWFGESLSPDALQEAETRVLESDMVWVVGTSALVYPAAALPEMAAGRGIPVVEVNPEETPITEHVPYSLRASASAGLTALTRAMGSGKS